MIVVDYRFKNSAVLQIRIVLASVKKAAEVRIAQGREHRRGQISQLEFRRNATPATPCGQYFYGKLTGKN
jgi:hypothetical protein